MLEYDSLLAVAAHSPRLPWRDCTGPAAAPAAGWSPREAAHSPPASASSPHDQLDKRQEEKHEILLHFLRLFSRLES